MKSEKLDINIVGRKVNKDKNSEYLTRESVICLISKYNLDEKSYEKVIKQINNCPENGLAFLAKNIDQIISNIKK